MWRTKPVVQRVLCTCLRLAGCLLTPGLALLGSFAKPAPSIGLEMQLLVRRATLPLRVFQRIGCQVAYVLDALLKVGSEIHRVSGCYGVLWEEPPRSSSCVVMQIRLSSGRDNPMKVQFIISKNCRDITLLYLFPSDTGLIVSCDSCIACSIGEFQLCLQAQHRGVNHRHTTHHAS